MCSAVGQRPHPGVSRRDLCAAGHPGESGGAQPHAQPGSLLHRGRRHPAGGAGRSAAGVTHVFRAAPAGLAGQHIGAAHGQLAQRSQPVPQCADGPGDGHVDCAGDGDGGAGARQPPPPARRARPGRCAGFSQGDGGLAGDRVARARSGGPHHLRQPGLLRDGGLQPAGAAGSEHVGTLLAARACGGIPPAPGRPLCGHDAAARGV